MEVPDAVHTYYDALDDGDYDALRGVLGPEFTQRRPDRTFESREAFVRFMRDDRPRTDTVHVVDRVYLAGDASTTGVGTDGAEHSRVEDDGPGRVSAAGDTVREVAARGQLLAGDGGGGDGDSGDGDELVAFVDVFRVVDGRLAELRTYTG